MNHREHHVVFTIGGSYTMCPKWQGPVEEILHQLIDDLGAGFLQQDLSV